MTNFLGEQKYLALFTASVRMCRHVPSVRICRHVPQRTKKDVRERGDKNTAFLL